MKKEFKSIDEYILTFSPEVRDILRQIRQVIHQAAPEAVETISYQMPTFDLNGKHLVHFAAWKEHISLYPTPAGNAAFQQEIQPYLAAKSTLQFPLDQPIPLALIENIVRLRVKDKSGNKVEISQDIS